MADPYASIVILTTGTPTRVLECLKKQTFKDFEVLIASEKGIVNAMNLALARAKGEIFIRVDDDVDIPSEWLGQLVKPFLEPIWPGLDFRPGAVNYYDPRPVAGVTGPTFVPWECRHNRDSIKIWENPNWFLRWMMDDQQHAPAKILRCGSVSYGSNYIHKMKRALRYKIDHLEGTNWAMRTALIRQVGGFDPKFDGVAEWFDTDVEQKIKKLGYRLEYNVNACLWHLLEKTDHYNDRFDGWGRIKNWLRYHKRHSKFHWKMVVFLLVWIGYFIEVKIDRWLESNKEKKWHW